MRNGGNTATAVKPAGTKATADAAAGLPKTLGVAPPPEDPGTGEPGGAPPAPIAGGAGIMSIIVTAITTAATAAERTGIRFDQVDLCSTFCTIQISPF